MADSTAIQIPEGVTLEEYFKSRNRAHSLVLLEELYTQATAEDAPFSRKLELYKLTTKLGDLEPKQTVAAAGSKFSIRIVFNEEENEKVVSGVTVDNDIGMDMLDTPPAFMTPSFITDNLASLRPPAA